MNQEDQKIIADYLPKEGRYRSYYADKHIRILVCAERIEGEMWRPRFAFDITIGRKVYPQSKVFHDQLFTTKMEARVFAYHECAKALGNLFTWSDKSLKPVIDELLPFRNNVIYLALDHKQYKIW